MDRRARMSMDAIIFSDMTMHETDKLAQAIAVLLDPVDCVLLKGELGSGKTTFARALIDTLSLHLEEVVSPTFTLVQQYDVMVTAGGKAELLHYDLYRLKSRAEAMELGMEDAFQNTISLIEWPELVADILPADRLEIGIAFAGADDKRTMTLTPFGKWEDTLKELHDAIS